MNLGVMYWDQGKWDTAIDFHKQALEIFRAINDVHSEGQSQGNLGNVYRSQGNWGKAIDYYKQALEIFSSAINDVHSEGKNPQQLGHGVSGSEQVE